MFTWCGNTDVRRSCRLLVAIPIALLLSLMSVSIVGAHAEYRSSIPANGSTVATPPTQVVITFSQETSATESNGSVADAAGTVVSTGWSVDLNERTKLTIGLKPNLGNGIYTVTYTSMSQDGHVVDGSFIFTVDPNAAATAATASGTGAPWGLWLLIAAVSIVAIIGGLFVIRSRAGGSAPSPTDETPA